MRAARHASKLLLTLGAVNMPVGGLDGADKKRIVVIFLLFVLLPLVEVLLFIP